MCCSCSTSYKMKRGSVNPSDFHETITVSSAKGIMLVPCEYEGEVENYYFDTGAQLTDIQRTELKGERVSVRGASNRTKESDTEELKSFKIGNVEFKNTFATNTDAEGLKEQIPNYGGTLGRPIIDRANWLIDLRNNTLTISNKELSDNTYADIDLVISDIGAPHSMINIDGKSYRAIIDLGSTAMLNVPDDSELATYLLNNYEFKDHQRDRYTVGGIQRVTEIKGVLNLLKLGVNEFNDVDVSINKSSQIRVGMNLFKEKIIYIDNLNKKYRIK